MSEPNSETVVVIGAGHAAGELATSLRQNGHAGPIVLVGEEPWLPYQRPPLSKGFLSGEAVLESLYLKPQATYEKAQIEVILGVRVDKIDRAAKRVALSDGRSLDYGKLVLATGGRVRRMQGENAEFAEKLSNVHYLRTIADVEKIRAQFEHGLRLTIIGGGYVGLEVAAVAVKHGLHVTVLEAAPRVLARVTAPELSAFYERVHREAGVNIATGVEVKGFEFDASRDAVEAVLCGDGTRVVSDLVIVGIGLIPNTELAAEAGLAVDNGIVVDEYCRTADADIFAVGDCTNHPNPIYGRRLRLESVPNAVEQARTAAATICGKGKPYAQVPWFWSDQYDLKLQMVGLSQGYDRLVMRGDPTGRSFAAFYLKDGKLIAADAVNRPQDFMFAKRLVAANMSIDAAILADESQPLKALLPAGNS